MSHLCFFSLSFIKQKMKSCGLSVGQFDQFEDVTLSSRKRWRIFQIFHYFKKFCCWNREVARFGTVVSEWRPISKPLYRMTGILGRWKNCCLLTSSKFAEWPKRGHWDLILVISLTMLHQTSEMLTPSRKLFNS